MRNAGLDETQAGNKIAGRNINNLRYAGDTTFTAESKEELKSLLMKVKAESEKVDLQLLKTKIMASSPITSWQIDGETWKQWETLFGGLQNHCRWWQLPWNLKMVTSWKKIYDQPGQHNKKQRPYFANKVPFNQSYGFSLCHVWMCELEYTESWVQKNWCFWTVVLDKTLESPLAARRSNQSILKEINPEYPLEALMLKLKFQYFGHLRQRANSLEKTLMLAKIEGRRRRGWQRDGWMASLTQWTWVWAISGRWWRRGKPALLVSMGSQRVGHDLTAEQ